MDIPEDLRLWALRVATKEALNGIYTVLTATASSLYGYAEFEGDAIRLYNFPETKQVKCLPTMFDHLKAKIQRVWEAADEILRQCWGESCGLSDLPWWLKPKWKSVEIVLGRKELSVRIQDALIAQIWLLGKMGLTPRMVLVSSHFRMNLIAVKLSEGSSEYAVSYIDGKYTFMGLPVVLCDEMKYGAIVV
jgi:hypothetical protein